MKWQTWLVVAAAIFAAVFMVGAFWFAISSQRDERVQVPAAGGSSPAAGAVLPASASERGRLPELAPVRKRVQDEAASAAAETPPLDWFTSFFTQLREMTSSPANYHDRAFTEIQRVLLAHPAGDWSSRHNELVALSLDLAENPLLRGSALLLMGHLFPEDRRVFLLPLLEDYSQAPELRHAAAQGIGWGENTGVFSFEIKKPLEGYEKAGAVYPLKFGGPLDDSLVIERLLSLIERPAPPPPWPQRGDFYLFWPDFLLRNLAALALGGSLAEQPKVRESFENSLDSKAPSAFMVRDSILFLIRKNPAESVQQFALRYYEKLPPGSDDRALLALDLLMLGTLARNETLFQKLHDPKLDEMEKEALFIGLTKEMETAGASKPELAYLLYEETMKQEKTARASALSALAVSPFRDLTWMATQRMLLNDPEPYNRRVAASCFRPQNESEKKQFVQLLENAYELWPDEMTRQGVLRSLGRYAPEKLKEKKP